MIQRAPPRCEWALRRSCCQPGASLQATEKGEAVLAGLVDEHAGKAKNHRRPFAGLGPFALRLAARARVTAVDNDAAALTGLARAAAAPGLTGRNPKARSRPPALPAPELDRFDAVIFDPPRQGAEAQAREIARSKVPIVIAMSCNPASFARDARILIDGGYHLGAVRPVDQFRYAAHVEIVGRFER